MAWERRTGTASRYYYLSERGADGRVRKLYCGGNDAPAAALAAYGTFESVREAGLTAAERRQAVAAERAVAALRREARSAAAETLRAAGYEVGGGRWRLAGRPGRPRAAGTSPRPANAPQERAADADEPLVAAAIAAVAMLVARSEVPTEATALPLQARIAGIAAGSQAERLANAALVLANELVQHGRRVPDGGPGWAAWRERARRRSIAASADLERLRRLLGRAAAAPASKASPKRSAAVEPA